MKTTNLTNLAIWSLYLNMGCLIISAISSYYQFNLLVGISKGIYQPNIIDELAISNDNREQILGILTFLSYIICFFIIGRWIFISSKITTKTRAEDLSLSPGWSVGWYFIPIFNLWKPYQCFKKIYKVSIDWRDWKNVVIPSIIRWWWALWIITSIIGQAQFRGSMNFSSIETLKLISLSYIFVLPLELILNFIFIKIIRDISDRHNSEEFQKLIEI